MDSLRVKKFEFDLFDKDLGPAMEGVFKQVFSQEEVKGSTHMFNEIQLAIHRHFISIMVREVGKWGEVSYISSSDFFLQNYRYLWGDKYATTCFIYIIHYCAFCTLSAIFLQSFWGVLGVKEPFLRI